LTLGCANQVKISPDSEHRPKALSAYQNNDSEDSLKNLDTFRGRYTYGHEVRTLILCDDFRELWVLDNTNGLLVHNYKTLTSEPYQPIFVEVKGKITEAPEDGFGEEYQAAIIIEAIIHASRIGESSKCPKQ